MFSDTSLPRTVPPADPVHREAAVVQALLLWVGDRHGVVSGPLSMAERIVQLFFFLKTNSVVRRGVLMDPGKLHISSCLARRPGLW